MNKLFINPLHKRQKLVEKIYNWEQIAMKLLHLYEKMVTKRIYPHRR